MRKRTAIIVGIILLGLFMIILPPVQLELRAMRARAFLKQVATLPREEISAYALRCASLYTNYYTTNTVVITNQETLNQFILLSKPPDEIYISQDGVDVEYSVWYYGAPILCYHDERWTLHVNGLTIYDPSKLRQ